MPKSESHRKGKFRVQMDSQSYTSGKFALSYEQVEKLLSVIDVFEEEVLIRVAIDTGIRREDLVGLQTGNVSFKETEQGLIGTINFWESKKKRNWTSYVSGVTAKILKQHLNAMKSSKYVFPSREKRAKHMSGRTAYNIYQKYLKKAGIKGRPFHTLRATCMKLAKKRGLSIEETMKQTGDSWKTISMHYTTPSDEEMQDAFLKKPLFKND